MKSMKNTMPMRSLAATLLLALCTAAQAVDDTPQTRRVAADRLVQTMDELTGPKRMMAGMQGMMQAPMQQALAQNPRLTPAQQQRASEVLSKAMTESLTETMGSVMPAVYSAMTQMYVERFTLAEIEQLNAFYASAVVRKATVMSIEEMPRLMQPMMQSMQQIGPQIKQRMDAASEQLKREGIDLSPPKPASKPAAKPADKKA
jgi:hypothetical protein